MLFRSFRIRKVAYNSGTNSYGAVTTLYDTNPSLNQCLGIRLSPDQSTLYICFYHGIAKIDLSTNQFSILTGSLTSQGTADGTGTAATFSGPKGIAIDLNGMFYCTRKAMPMIKAAGGGSILNLSSIAGRLGFPMRTP